MLPGLLFGIWRTFQIITLIPTLGMLSYFVNGYTKNNQLTPSVILVLFIVSVLACVWAVATLLAYNATRYNAMFVAIVDLLFVGALIAGVYYLRGITNEDCTSWGRGESRGLYFNLGIFGSGGASINSPFAVNVNKNCAMLKASFAFGIINILLFFTTFMILLLVHREHGTVVYSRRSTSRHRSRSPRHHSPHRTSHRSSHSYSRRTYV